MLNKTKSALAVTAAVLALGAGAQAAYAQDANTAASTTGGSTASAPTVQPAQAATPGTAAVRKDMHKGPHGPHRGPPPGGPGAGFAHMMDHLHDSLHLTATQETAWNTARDTSRKNFDTMRTQHQVVFEQMRDASKQPILDLGALQTQREQLEHNDLEMRNATEKAFVDFYNTLDDHQKTLVSNDIKASWHRMMRHDGRPPMPNGPHGAHRPHGGPGKMPPPPPPGDAPPPPPAQPAS